MSIGYIDPRHYGHEHRWFAWLPVNTSDHGWQWLRPLYRRMCHVDVQPYPSFWTYNRHPQTQGDNT